jgi:hypothetical protein
MAKAGESVLLRVHLRHRRFKVVGCGPGLWRNRMTKMYGRGGYGDVDDRRNNFPLYVPAQGRLQLRPLGSIPRWLPSPQLQTPWGYFSFLFFRLLAFPCYPTA